MKQCRMDCIHIDACRRFADNSTYWNSGDCPIYKSAADVAPKSEVAREIFEEIDKTVFADMDFFKELKKKYTEEQV